MATTHGGTDRSLIRRVHEEGRRFEFAQAAVALRRLLGTVQESGGRREEDRLRFAGDHALTFPAAQTEVLPERGGRDDDRRDAGVVRLQAPFLGLTGTLGALPAHMSELLIARGHQGDRTLERFLEMFQNRLVRQFLEAHLKNRFWLAFGWSLGERVDGPGLEQRALHTGHAFEDLLYALMGVSLPRAREHVGLSPVTLLHHAGILGRRPRSASAVAGVLSNVLGVEVSVIQLLGDWTDIPESEQSRLGRAGLAELGHSMVLGDRFFDPSRGFRVRCGPMGLDDLLRLLPGGEDAHVVDEFVPYAVGPDAEFDIELELHAGEVPPARLTHDERAPQRLGHTLWLFADDDGPQRGPVVSGPFHPSQRTTDESPDGENPWSRSA